MRLTFYGEESEFAREHFHKEGNGEAPWTMFWPCVVLAVGTVLVGFLSLGFGFKNIFADWLSSTVSTIEPTTGDDLITTAISWAFGVAGGVLVWRAYESPARIAATRRRFAAVAPVAAEPLLLGLALRADRLPACRRRRRPSSTASVSAGWPGASLDVVGWIARAASRAFSEVQTGVVRLYAGLLVVGAAGLAVFFIGKANL